MQDSTTNINVASDFRQIKFRYDDKDKIFLDETDYDIFLSILRKYLLNNDSVEALAYCLEPDHFCLLLNQLKANGAKDIMQNILNDYGAYHHKKYMFEKLLSEGDYEESKIAPNDLLDISRDIHLLPEDWKEYPHSSIRAYFYDDTPKWLNKDYITEQYGSAVQYLEFLES